MSKESKFIDDALLLKGFQCKKRFWLEGHRPELKVPDTSGRQWKVMVKDEVRTEALKLFEGAAQVRGRTAKAAAKATQKAIAERKPVLLDAVFIHGETMIRIDAMAWEKTGYSLYEIKSSAGIKDVYFNEAAIKWAIATLCKVHLVRSYVLHINNKYIREGELEPRKLFVQKNITQVVRRRQEEVIKMTDDLLSIKKDKPQIHIGSWCNDPYECDFRKHCWRDVPVPSVFDLHKLPGKKKFELYRQGIVGFEALKGQIELTPFQKHQIEAELHGKDYVDVPALKSFLNTIRYPVYFLDFETYQQAVPRFEKLRPYEQIPFQFSLHMVEREGAEPVHVEFLAEAGQDPRYLLAKRLVEVMGNEGTIVAYNQAFEKGVIRKLGESFPDLREGLEAMQGRFVDLMYPFEKGLYYTRRMNGRHSIKTVLPAMVPELSYQGMEIGHGGEAMNAYATLHLARDENEVQAVRKGLLEYCKLDTLAMVKIWGKLKILIKK